MKRTKFLCALGAVACAAHVFADDAPKQDFLSSLKQSFRQDYDHEVVRGHFDTGTAPSTHRYYCLIDPKSGKVEENGIAGTLVPRKDGMTGIQNASVSFYSCADAESKGLLITDDYHVTMAPNVHVTSTTPHKSPPAATAGTTSPGTAEPALKLSTTDPLITLQSFIDVYNSGDSAPLASLLGESADFAWIQPDGHIAWGYQAAAEALQVSRNAGTQLQLLSQEGHTISLASKNAILITKLRLTQTSQDPRMIRCSSVMVLTSKGWRIVSLFMSPETS